MLLGESSNKKEMNKITDINGVDISDKSNNIDLDLVEEELDAENIKSITSNKKEQENEKNKTNASKKSVDRRILGRIWQLTK